MTLFEEGITLTETCRSRLEAAEQKIQLLLKDSEGDLSLEDMD
jgi:exodeoxyribonuclease VII small subunit